jgi:signal transduction histidine kinase
MELLRKRAWATYVIALLGVGAATAIRFALHPVLGEHLIFSVYYLAVTIAAWAGGLWPALATAVLSSMLANLLFSVPRGSLRINDAEEFFALVLFLSVSTVIGVLSQLSLRSLARARLAEQQKDDFLALLAHELRNPLAVIHYANLDNHRVGPRNSQERTEIIGRQVEQLDQMIEDLMDVSRVSRGKFHLEFERVDALEVVDRALGAVRHAMTRRHHQLTVDRPSTELMLCGDPKRLEQVFTNLLTNAAKYTPPHGSIHLQVTSEDGCAVIRVRDNGEGVPKEMISRIFDLYTQVQLSMERSGTGLGIGLALVRTLVELHGGTVSATSEGPNRGSEFVVRLPLYEELARSCRETAKGPS